MATYPSDAGVGAPLIDPTVANLLGIVVKGGLSRSRLATDPLARAGGMQEASQCGDKTQAGYWDEWGVPAAKTLAAADSAELPQVVFQDAFNIGQALERRLNLLQASATGLPSQDPANVARGGIAELRSWAGATIVHAWPVLSGSGAGQTSSLVVRVGGMSYANDFGITPGLGAPLPSSVTNAFGFVYGPPWAAECAAGVHADCPAIQIQNATSATDVTTSYTAVQKSGSARP